MKKLLILLFSLVLLTGCTKTNDDFYRYNFLDDQYLDTVTSIIIYHHEGYDIEALEDGIFDILKETHQIYDSHDDSSEIGQVNLTAHLAPVEVSDELYVVIERALEVAAISNGAYDPTITPLTELWAIDDDSKWSNRTEIPSDEEIAEALNNVDYTKVILNDKDKTVFFEQDGITLDLGGISKGYIIVLLRDYIVSQGIEHAIINVGQSSQLPIGTRCAEKETTEEGAIYVATEDPWRIGTTDPFDLFGFNPPIGVFGLSDVALSSSGSSQRFFMVDDVRYHHIFDTETGYPADNELILIQILSDDVVGVDAISTMLYVMGFEAAWDYVESTDGLEAVFITYDKELYLSSGFGEYEIFNTEFTLKNKE